ncbi:sulfatase-like hydrolase/transferase [Paenibacillus sp. strain BS8-2]
MKRKPNILIIQSDQHRYDCGGPSKSYPVKTPHLDQLAAEGAWFNQAYTPIPLCCPARQAFIHGRRPESFGALWNYDQTLPTGVLDKASYAWPRELASSGYSTAYLGKWHVHPTDGPDAFGYEHVVTDEMHATYINEKYGEIQYDNGFFGEASRIPLEDTHTHYMTGQALNLMEGLSQEAGPWHLRIDFHAPHLPCHPAEPFASMYQAQDTVKWGSFEDKFENKPYIQRQQLYNWGVEHFTWSDWEPTVAMYYGYISQVDHAVGLLLDKLKQLKLDENTLVIYTSDHGDMCGGHRMMDKHYVMYDDVVKVPLVIRWPGHIQAGIEINDFVYNLLDLPPTLLDIIEADIPDFMHGRSLTPLWDKDGKDIGWRDSIICTYNGQQFGLFVQRMIRNEEWKYVWNPTDVDELYHLKSDPHEINNLIDKPEHASIVAALRQRLYKELSEMKDGAVAGPWMQHQLLNGAKINRNE